MSCNKKRDSKGIFPLKKCTVIHAVFTCDSSFIFLRKGQRLLTGTLQLTATAADLFHRPTTLKGPYPFYGQGTRVYYRKRMPFISLWEKCQSSEGHW